MRRAWSCVPLTRALWLTACSPISNGSQWTWRVFGNTYSDDKASLIAHTP